MEFSLPKQCVSFISTDGKELEKKGFELEGSGKNARHIKLRLKSELDPEIIEEMLVVVKNVLMR